MKGPPVPAGMQRQLGSGRRTVVTPLRYPARGMDASPGTGAYPQACPGKSEAPQSPRSNAANLPASTGGLYR